MMSQVVTKIMLLPKVLLLLYLVAVMGCTAAILSDSKASLASRSRGKSVKYVPNKTYEEECSACHVSYLPGFLTTKSWRKIMIGLEDHFGEDASLDKKPQDEIRKYLLANAANSPSATRRSKKIAALEGEEVRLRISETVFWTRRHESIKDYTWKRDKVKSKANCDSCHKDAAKGIYSEHDVDVPKD